MIKARCINLVFLGFCLLIPVPDSPAITLGYVDFPPYEYEVNGNPEGILVNIVNSLFARVEIPLELEYLPFKRAYKLTKAGSIDGLFNFYKTQPRLEFFDYSVPVIKNPLVFLVRNDSTLNFDSMEDLKGLLIGVMRGYTYGKVFDESLLFDKEATDSHEANMRKVIRSRIHAYPCDKYVGIYVARKSGLLKQLKILPKPLRIMDGHVGFTKGKHGELIGKINLEFEKMKESGEIDRIINTYMEKHLQL